MLFTVSVSEALSPVPARREMSSTETAKQHRHQPAFSQNAQSQHQTTKTKRDKSDDKTEQVKQQSE